MKGIGCGGSGLRGVGAGSLRGGVFLGGSSYGGAFGPGSCGLVGVVGVGTGTGTALDDGIIGLPSKSVISGLIALVVSTGVLNDAGTPP